MNNKVNHHPSVSIGMPAYNAEKYIERAIVTLLQQTHQDFELIISDDASTDATEMICQRYAHRDKRIKYIRQEKNIGFLRNFNFVLKMAKGTYFMWAGNDDYWDVNYIKVLVSLMKLHPDAVLAVSNFDNISNGRHYHNKPRSFTNNENRYQTLVNFIKTGELSFFYGIHLTENIKKVGGYQSSSRPFFRSSDYLTIFKVLLEGKMVYTTKTLFNKVDTGYYFVKYDILRNRVFSSDVLRVMIRYSFFPIFYVYDLVNSVKTLVHASLSFGEKSKIVMYLLQAYLRNNLTFCKSITEGILHLMRGLIV